MQKTVVFAVAVLNVGSMSLLCRSSFGFPGSFSVRFGEVGGGAHHTGDELN